MIKAAEVTYKRFLLGLAQVLGNQNCLDCNC